MKKLFTLALACILAFASYAQEPGEIDTNFGTDGSLVFHPSKVNKFGYFDFIYKVLVQEDGKILTIGESRTDGKNYSIYISRHNVDGTLDETYGEGGYVFLKVDPLIYKSCPYDAVLSEDGMLYLAGYAFNNNNGFNTGFILCLDENGFENEDYGDKGWAVTEPDGNGLVYEGIDIDSKGRCVVVGYYKDEIIVKRYNAKGKLDKTFGTDGTVYIEMDSSPNSHSYAYDVKILDDGKIVFCGDKRVDSEEGMFIWSYMMRLKSNGDVDATFGENGIVYLWTGEYAEFALSLAVQRNGKYLVGGHDELWSDTPELPRYESFITRVNTDGTIDETFGDEGYVKIEPLQGDGCVNYSYSILSAPDGQIFGTVYSRNISTDSYRGYVYNLTEDGQFNEDFVGSGIVPLPKVDDAQEELNTYSIALQGNDKLIIGGYIGFNDGDYTKLYLTSVNVAIEGEEEEESALVEITVTDVTTTTVEASFVPAEECASYYILLGKESEMAQWVAMMGVSLEQLVESWGGKKTGVVSNTWTELVPNTEYTLYALSKDADGNTIQLDTKKVSTAILGGEGVSVIDLKVEVRSTTSAFVTATPNEETSEYHYILIEKAYSDSIGVDSTMKIIYEDPYSLYVVDEWEWVDLKPQTEYYAIAQGKNVNGEWGEITKVEFITSLEGNIELVEKTFNIYPNPASSTIFIETSLNESAQVSIVDLTGRCVKEVEISNAVSSINLENVESGVYFISIQQGDNNYVEKLVVK